MMVGIFDWIFANVPDLEIPPWQGSDPQDQLSTPPPDNPGSNTGSVRLGHYSGRHSLSHQQAADDIPKITQHADILDFSETRAGHNATLVVPELKREGWDYYQGHQSDTAIGWNTQRYDALRKKSVPLAPTLWTPGHWMHEEAPEILFKDKQTGALFYVISAHTNHGGYRKGFLGGKAAKQMHKQYAQINAEINRLKASGIPVFLMGDLNNPHAQNDFGDLTAEKHGIDYIFYQGKDAKLVDKGMLTGQGFDHHGKGQLNTDHPFIYGTFQWIKNAFTPKN